MGVIGSREDKVAGMVEKWGEGREWSYLLGWRLI